MDFITTPEAVNNVITVVIPKGESQGTIVLEKIDGVGFLGDEEVAFTISSVEGASVVGSIPQIKVSFSEIEVTGGNINIQGGGPTYPNKVFMDLSASRQTAVNRTTWDLGFSSGDDFRVKLNSPNGMMARVLDKTDLNTVTAADTVGLGKKLSVAGVFAGVISDPAPDWLASSINWIDDPAGDITKTAIAAISATASENKVYIVNRGDGIGTAKLGWKKIRVIRNGAGYTLQYADIAATTFSEIQITKDATHAFQYVSLSGGLISVEPAKDKWDIAWTGFTNTTNSSVGLVPYYYQDIIVQNKDVQTAQVLTSAKTYEAFGESDADALDFGAQSQIKIGSNWRSGGGPTSGPSLRTDRFYVVKDAEGNIYKVRFTALTQSGERGKPALEFVRVKAAV